MTTRAYTVLLADDDEHVRLPVRVFFRRYPELALLEVSEPSGIRAHAAEADALVVDCKLTADAPDEGITTVAKLIQDRMLSPSVPIVFISNWEEDYAQFHRLKRDALRGRYVFIRKPFQSEYLLAQIRREGEKRAQHKGK